MSRPLRIVTRIGIAVAALLVVVLAGTFFLVQTEWFRAFVRQKIITATEESTGGKVEVGSFSFEWSRLEAVVTDFTIHGREPAGAAPFVSAPRVELRLRLFTSIRRPFELAFLRIDKPQANIMVFPDGSTNIPSPRVQSNSETTGLESVVDLAIGHFELNDGLVTFNSQKQPLDMRANNLRAELWYNALNQSYRGQLSLQPLYVARGRNTPVNFVLTLPMALQRDRIEIQGGSISTDASRIAVNGSIENLRNPVTSAHVKGRIAFSDLKNLGDVPVALNGRSLPDGLDIDANATFANNRIDVTGVRLNVGGSQVEASGTLKDPDGNGSLEFKSRLALGEIGRLAGLAARPEGTLSMNGTAAIDSNNNYRASGYVLAENVSFEQGGRRTGPLTMSSDVRVDERRLDLNDLKLIAFGGELTGDATLEDFARYKFNGNLRRFDIRTALRSLGQRDLPYAGAVSGTVAARGDLKAPGTGGVNVQAKLTIAPGKNGVPVSGRLNVNYDGAGDAILVQNSYINLPHSRLTLSGSLPDRLAITLTTRDLNDLLAGVGPTTAAVPVLLPGGQASFSGAATGRLTSPRLAGHLSVTRFKVDRRVFDSLSADVSAASSGAAVSNGTLARPDMEARFAGSVGLKNWSPTQDQRISADASIRNGDLADVMVLLGKPGADYSGTLSLNAHVAGTVGNPSGGAELLVDTGVIMGEPFDRLHAKLTMADQLITIPSAFIAAGGSRVDLAAEYRHPRETLSAGQVHLRIRSNQADLAKVRTLQKQWANTSGQLKIEADITGTVANSEFKVSSVTADASARDLHFQGQPYGAVAATALTNGQTVSYKIDSDFAGSDIHVNGATDLAHGYPTKADATISRLPIERLLVLAKRTDIRAKGNLSAEIQVSGTLDKPEGGGDIELVNAVIYDEPIDRLQVRATYRADSIDIPQFEITSGPSRLDMTVRYDHPAGNLQAGELQFRVNSSGIDLLRIRNLQRIRPDLAGKFQIAANGSATVRASSPRIFFRDLNANIAATGVSDRNTSFGDFTLAANAIGQRLNFTVNSNLANAAIKGQGNAELAGDYPLNAEVTFNNVVWSRVQGLLGSTAGARSSFDAVTDGKVTVSGPAMKTAQLRGAIELTRLQLNTLPPSGASAKSTPIVIQNQGTIVVAIDRGEMRVANFHLTGPDTQIEAAGTASFENGTLNLSVKANTKLDLLRSFDPEVNAAGSIVLDATVRGTTAKPLLNGQLQLQGASLNFAGLPAGLSNANGVIVLAGNSASVRNLVAEVGGGTVRIGGFARFGEAARFGLRANATNVRLRVQPGVSVVTDANIQLSGGAQSSLVSGVVDINQINYAPQTDLGSMLTRAAPPVQSPRSPSPILDNMKLDIRVRTSASTAVYASGAQNLRTDADLRIRGSAAQPGVLGRVSITEGQLVFFGSTYTVSSGTISFYNPVRIEPILNVSLETTAKGVNVSLTATGAIDNMKLSYTSDPPLQFQEIVSLLASGKTPTSDPTLLANQPSQQPQSFEQMGASALMSKALADPVSSRLERVFGVSQLKVDPTFISGSELPQARLTLQQQITDKITFTYVTALNDPNTQIIRAEWAMNPRWSAIATRDQNGMLSVNLFYKKQFR